MTIPRGVSDITREWLDRALSVRYPGVVVDSCEIVEVIAMTASKVRLRLTFKQNGRQADLPEAMILKGGLAGLAHETELLLLYRNEAAFYRDIAPYLDVEVPRCFFAGTDGETGVVLFEDLAVRGVTFGAGAQPLTPELAATALDYQADFHARWWGDEQTPLCALMSFENFFDWFWGQPWLVGVGANAPASAPRGASLLTQARAAVADLAVFKRAVMTAHALNQHAPQSLVHADPHPGNMYFDADGAPRWLDWQLATRGCWAWDVAYFMIGALAVEDRRTHEKPLLRHYLDRLSARGVAAPSWEEAWLAYRRNAIWGLSWALVPEQMQIAANGDPIIERFATAIRDLGTMEALGIQAPAYDFDLPAAKASK